MERYLPLLRQTALFAGVGSEQLPLMLNCLGAYRKSYRRGDYIFHQEERLSTLCIVLQGSVFLLRDDYAGNREIIAAFRPGQLFGEAFACLPQQPLHCDAIAQEPTELLFLEIRKVLTVCSSACEFHHRVIENLLYLLAEQNLRLNLKLEHLSHRTTREKLLSYLHEQSRGSRSRSFSIPFNRQQLADYLAVDRSAMCRELSRLQREGLISYHKNIFCLQDAEE